MAKQRDDDSRKHQIRAAAVRCFVQRGFTATRLLDIARQAGLSKGGVYFYYNTKEALFADVVDAQVAQLQARWGFSPTEGPPADTLERLVVAHLRTIEDEPDETRLGHLLTSMAPQQGPVRDRLEDSLQIMRSLYASVIHRGVREGAFRNGEPDQLADLVLAFVQGLAVQTATDPEGRLPVRPDVAAEHVLHMLQPRGPRAVASEPVAPRPTLHS